MSKREASEGEELSPRSLLLPAALGLFAAGCTRIDSGPPIETHPEPIVLTDTRVPEPRPQPRSRTVRLGESVQGTPLVLRVFGDGPDTVFIFGGIHGSEPTSADLAAELIRYLEVHPEEWTGRTIAVLAVANPDGLARGNRLNAHGVDLNRNFPADNWRRAGQRDLRHGANPASEPETQAILRAVERIRPRRAIAIHSIARGRHCNNYDGDGENLARLMTECNGYRAAPAIGYPTPGSFGSWAGTDHGIPTITLELPRDARPETCWRENRDALLAFIRAEAVLAE